MPIATPVCRDVVELETRARPRTLVGVYAELGKARLSMMVVITAAVGFVLASGAAVDWLGLLATSAGTLLAALGANAWNQCVEVERDRRMERTRNRPLPAGRISPRHAQAFALLSGLAGPALLLFTTNALTAGLAMGCLLIYVLAYTPLKPISPLNTLVGAVCGALPPMLGWTAVTGQLDLGAWILGAILFVWQIPHFLALAWLYRADYARGGFRMLPMVDPDGGLTCNVALLYSAALLPLCLLLSYFGLTGAAFAYGATLLGAGLVALALRLYHLRTRSEARRLFLASIIYLPLLLIVLVWDRVPQTGRERPAPPSAIGAAVALGGADQPR
jgi:protoheme IX farnesyltransferase